MESTNWAVCRTRIHHEKILLSQAQAIGIKGFVPFVQRELEWNDRRVKRLNPLLPGYFFVQPACENDLRTVKRFTGFAGYLMQFGRPAPVTEIEIETLKCAVKHHAQPAEFKDIPIGAQITIMRGPFAGQSGSVLAIQNKRITVAIAAPLSTGAFKVQIRREQIQ